MVRIEGHHMMQIRKACTTAAAREMSIHNAYVYTQRTHITQMCVRNIGRRIHFVMCTHNQPLARKEEMSIHICNMCILIVEAEKEEVAGTQTGSEESAAKRGRPAKATLSESDFLLADEFAVLSAHHGWVEEPQERAPGFYNANDAVASAYTTFRDSHLLEMQDGQDPSDALNSDVERRRMLMLRLWQNIRNMRQLEPSYVEAALKEGVERHGLSDLQ